MKKLLILFTMLSLPLAGCSLVQTQKSQQSDKEIKYAVGNVVKPGETYKPAWVRNEDEINRVLSHQHACSDHLILRYQTMSKQAVNDACKLLLDTETRFHNLFGTEGKPVKHDNNRTLRANIYASRDAYVEYVTAQFDVPSNNGGMYLEGLPDRPDNQAEYVAYMEKGTVRNLNHEFVHYLDGRYNTYGDFCATLHDNHSGPEYCPKPAPLLPHLTWWTEGVAEYVAHGDDNPAATDLAAKQSYRLSELFNTSGQTWSTERVYRWGYLAVRYMMEEQRDKVEEILVFTRTGDYPRYQALVTGWGTSMDGDFSHWLETL